MQVAAGCCSGVGSHFVVADMNQERSRPRIPFVEGNYQVKTNRESRAIAGLSVGGEQAVFMGLNHGGSIRRIGSFSGRSSSPGDNGVTAAMLTANFPHHD